MGHHSRHLDQALNPPEALGEVNQLKVFDEFLDIQTSPELKGNHRPKAARLLGGHRVPWEVRKARVVDLGNVRIRLEEGQPIRQRRVVGKRPGWQDF